VSQVAEPPPVTSTERPPRRRRRGPFSRSSLTRDILEVLALALALYIIITFALQTVRVEGTSMVPTLDNSDLLFADKISYHLHAPDRGDIVILEPPDDPTKDFIKRVIGLPGDHLKILSNYLASSSAKPRAAVEVQPNGQGAWQVLNEPYLPDQTKDPWIEMTNCCTSDGRASPEPNELVVPTDQYFVLGDNRNASKDSRTIGLIPRNKILGRAWLRIWPLGRFGFLGSGPTLTAALMLPLPLWKIRVRVRRRRNPAG
jgi:signal peptidase I